MESFGDVLKSFKEAEEPENIVSLIDDESLRNGLVAWKSVRIEPAPTDEVFCSATDPVERWEWLWHAVRFDRAKFGIVAGVKAQEAGTLLTRLIGLRLIYPDGTVNNFASQYLQSIIMAKLHKVGKTKP